MPSARIAERIGGRLIVELGSGERVPAIIEAPDLEHVSLMPGDLVIVALNRGVAYIKERPASIADQHGQSRVPVDGPSERARLIARGLLKP